MKNFKSIANQMDLISCEIATYHRSFLNVFFKEFYEKGLIYNEETHLAIYFLLKADLKKYNFTNFIIDNSSVEHIISQIDYGKLNEFLMLVDGNSLYKCIHNEFVHFGKEKFLNIEVISPIMDNVESITKNNIDQTDSFDEFKVEMQQQLFSKFDEINNYYDYLVSKVFFELYIDSIDFWGNYFCITKGKVWDFVKQSWNDIRPAVAADAGGAVAGALGGACAGAMAGGVGAVPGAAVGAVGGACGASVAKGIEILMG